MVMETMKTYLTVMFFKQLFFSENILQKKKKYETKPHKDIKKKKGIKKTHNNDQDYVSAKDRNLSLFPSCDQTVPGSKTSP